MKEKIKEDLDLLKRWQLIDMIVDMEKTITKYENKERHETKQRPIPDDWRINE
tara:strand:- start:85 stop:243 length:159 start_codon:yes stop_codon:yes gene_type:complete